jgi:ClpP class serine protease
MPNWHEVFVEIQTAQAQGQVQAINAQNIVRLKYLQLLHAHTGRNIIAYYSGWLSKGSVFLSDINDEDKNGFMTTIHKLDKTRGLDLILHTPGGGIAATQSIVNYLQKMFGKNIRAIVPQIAMSAGTVMACCCKEIWMGKQSSLGPIDPQMRGIPAHGVIQEFKRAVREVKRDASRIVIWQQIIGQYRPTFLGQCENALKWSNDFVQQQLADGMFEGLADKNKKAKAVTKALSDYPTNKSHDRHFDIDDCEKMGLVVKRLEADPTMQDLTLTVHHCYMNALMNGPAFKMIENQNGVAMVKNIPGASQAPNQRQMVEQSPIAP